MNLHQHPELLDRLAASHALGTLRGGARRRFEALARRHPVIQAASAQWQERLAGLTELQAAVDPPPYVWTRIANLTQARQPQTTPRSRWWNSLPLWRGAALTGALASVAVMVVSLRLTDQLRTETAAQLAELRQQMQAPSAQASQYVAVLLDAQAKPALLVSLDAARQQLVLQRVGEFQEGGDKSLQLWALPTQGQPRSLGVLERSPVMRLAAGEDAWRTVAALAVSLEPLGGVPGAGGPTGPVLFKGSLIQRML